MLQVVSIFEAEPYVILAALRYVEEELNTRICIFSDSRATSIIKRIK